MAWFRFYDEVLDDPKVQCLPPDIFKAWVNILCLAKRHDGVLPRLEDIAFALRTTDVETSKLLIELNEYGLLDKTETGLEPHNWKKYQYTSDVSTERVKQFRKRRETVSRNAPEQSRTDTDTETEEEIYIRQFDEFWSLVPRKVGKGQARKAFRAALKKTNWETLDAGIFRYAQEVAGKDDEFIAHPATWLNGERWLDEPERKPHGNQHRGNGAGRPSAHDTMLAAHAFAATSRPDAGKGEDIPPDGRGKGDAGKPAARVPHLPSARRED